MSKVLGRVLAVTEIYLLGLALAGGVYAAESGSSPAPSPQLIESGKKIYLANCAACHNSSPQKDGTIGPAVAGASSSLLEARLLKAAYPDGYKPKRPTKVMVAMPHLKDHIPALHAYLTSLQ